MGHRLLVISIMVPLGCLRFTRPSYCYSKKPVSPSHCFAEQHTRYSAIGGHLFLSSLYLPTHISTGPSQRTTLCFILKTLWRYSSHTTQFTHLGVRFSGLRCRHRLVHPSPHPFRTLLSPQKAAGRHPCAVSHQPAPPSTPRVSPLYRGICSGNAK